MNVVLSLFDRLPPLSRKRNPGIALIWGLLLGGIGLGIYLRSWLDAAMPVAVLLLLSIKFGTGSVGYGAALAGVWGAIRVVSSNRQLDAQAAA